MGVNSVCVVGTGNGGIAVAGNLALDGRKVTLYDCEAFQDNLAIMCLITLAQNQ